MVVLLLLLGTCEAVIGMWRFDCGKWGLLDGILGFRV